MSNRVCVICCEPFSRDLSMCPHCASPSLYPNVESVGIPEERGVLEQRYRDAKERAIGTNREELVKDLEVRAMTSEACKAMAATDIAAMALNDTRVGATYYGQIAGGTRLPDSNEWDVLRRIADAAIHRSYGGQITFAALSTSHRWLSNYGDGAVFFKDAMVQHRATVFEQNSATWAQKCSGDLKVPPGKQALWADRHKLVVAKLADASLPGVDLDSLIISSGSSSATDDYLEVHIFGTFTARSAARIAFKKGAVTQLQEAAIRERATARGILIEEAE